MSGWCIAFFVLLFLLIIIMVVLGWVLYIGSLAYSVVDQYGILTINVAGTEYNSKNAPANTLFSLDQSSMFVITSATPLMPVNGSTTNFTFTINGYTAPIPASMNIISAYNPPVAQLPVTVKYPPRGTVGPTQSMSFKAIPVTTSKPVNIDTSLFTADSSLPAYTGGMPSTGAVY